VSQNKDKQMSSKNRQHHMPKVSRFLVSEMADNSNAYSQHIRGGSGK
jgi:hypothetical protein